MIEKATINRIGFTYVLIVVKHSFGEPMNVDMWKQLAHKGLEQPTMIHVKSKETNQTEGINEDSTPRLIGISPLNRPLNDPSKPTHILPSNATFKQVQQCTRPNCNPHRASKQSRAS